LFRDRRGALRTPHRPRAAEECYEVAVKIATALVVACALAGCPKNATPDAEARAARSRDGASTPAQGDAGADAAPAQAWTKVTATGGPLASQVQAEIKRARAQKLKPVVYGSAVWCGPCQAIKKYRSDPRMADAFRGTYVIELDVDDWTAPEIVPLYPKLRAMPVFIAVGDDGKATGPQIDGGAWGDNIPENMAPPLKAFFAKL
jgi:thiol-disulfide isomerase/thioredoxin